MKSYNKTNIIVGWIVFLIAAITYLLTMEPTASFWDCGEFIASTYKLEVGHPPGAPLFMIVGRFFSLFASGVENVAMMINSLSALASSFTILFLFWTITHLAKKILVKSEDKLTKDKIMIIMGSGIVGALAYTFSDTFWFSAVEGEVYASSSLFTAAVFWAILKWENVADEPYSNRWLVLIAYLMGLSIGVHLLNLLAIPAIVMVYYFRKFETTTKGTIYAALISIVILGGIQYGIIPGLVKVASWFELLFTNSLGAPYNTGNIIYSILLISLIVGGIIYSYKKKKVVLNTILTCISVIIIGYSSFAMIVIRSLANPPMDENNPDNVFSLLSYLNREQYGNRPLLTGAYFNAPAIAEKEGKKNYVKLDGKYKVSYQDTETEFEEDYTTFFPRIYSRQSSHITGYKTWCNLTDADLYEPYYDQNGQPVIGHNNEIVYNPRSPKNPPSFADNLEFLFKYQLGHMYFRYFMWNFAGRQNDLQGHFGGQKGAWISGIKFIDEIRLGSQDLPSSLESKSKNKYYFLPLILGLIGLFFMLNISIKDFSVVMLLFFFTGIAIILYLNQTPFQPRERDYAYAGSFYVFTIWIGFGVISIYNAITKGLKKTSPTIAIAVIVLCTLLVPLNMAAENWDDHDRSGRYTARDFARNYLESCAPNAILFTYGDNDTFPLWYAQEVEGIRTDVRVVNLSLLATDWYITQMKRKAYQSEAVPFSLTYDKYIMGKRDIIPLRPDISEFIDLKRVLEFIASDSPKAKLQAQDAEYNYSPTRRFKIEVDSAEIVENKVIPPADISRISKEIKWELNREYIGKSELMILDLLANNNWERPIYFAGSIGVENFMGLQKYFRLEGFAYRFVPIETEESELGYGEVNTDILYKNLMEKFSWGRMFEDDVYIDEYNRRNVSIMEIHNVFARLANKLIEEQKKDKAIKVLDKCVKILPNDKFPFDDNMIPIIEGYYKLADFEKGNKVASVLAKNCLEQLEYYIGSKGFSEAVGYESRLTLQTARQLTVMCKQYEQNQAVEDLDIFIKNIMGQ